MLPLKHFLFLRLEAVQTALDFVEDFRCFNGIGVVFRKQWFAFFVDPFRHVFKTYDLSSQPAAGTPFAIVRGIDPSVFGEGSISENVIRRAAEDLFR